MDAGVVSWLTVGPLWISLFAEATNARAIVAVSIPALTANAACTRNCLSLRRRSLGRFVKEEEGALPRTSHLV